MNYLVPILICLSLLIFLYRKSIYDSFIKMLATIWLLTTAIYFFVEGFFVPLSKNFAQAFCFFFLPLLLFYTIAYLSSAMLKKVSIRPFLSPNILFGVSIFSATYSIFVFFYIFHSIGSMVLFRDAVLNGNISLGVGISFPFAAGSYFYCRLHKLKKKMIFFMIIMFMLAFISSSKMFFIIAMLFLSGLYIENIYFSAKKIIIIFILGFLIFSMLHILMNKIAYVEGDSLLVSLLYTLCGYYYGGFSVFQLCLDGVFSSGKSYQSFVDFLIGNAVQTGRLYENGWVETGGWFGNVSSGFTPWYEYLGYYGLSLYGSIIGFVYGVINYGSKLYSGMIFLRVFSIYPIIFIIFNDTFLRAATIWFGFIFVAIMLIFIEPKLKNERKCYFY